MYLFAGDLVWGIRGDLMQERTFRSRLIPFVHKTCQSQSF